MNSRIDDIYDSLTVHRQEIDFISWNTSGGGSFVNVLDFGAKNTGYESDSLINFNAIKEAWNYAVGGTLYFPGGTYITTEIGSAVEGFIYDNSLMSIKGDGIRRSVIKLANSGKNHLINTSGTKWHNFVISDIAFQGNQTNRKELVKIGGYNYSLQNVHIRHSGFIGLSATGLQFSLINVESELNDSISLLLSGCRNVTVLASSFESAKVGIYITSLNPSGTRVYENQIKIISPYFENNPYNIIIDATNNISVDNPTFDTDDTILVKGGACYSEINMMNSRNVLILEKGTFSNVIRNVVTYRDGRQWLFDYGNNKIIDH